MLPIEVTLGLCRDDGKNMETAVIGLRGFGFQEFRVKDFSGLGYVGFRISGSRVRFQGI